MTIVGGPIQKFRVSRLATRSGLLVFVLSMVSISVPFGHGTSSAQTLSSPSATDPKCPPAAPTRFSSASVQTPAWVVRQWLTKFRQEVPDSTDSKLLAAVDPKAHVAWCVVPRQPASATNGLGTTADAAVVVVTSDGTDDIARLDSARIYVAAPPSTAKGVDPLPDGALYSGNVRIVLPIPQTAPTDQALIDALSSDAFVDENTIVGIGPYTEDQPGRLRIERLVVADPCGVLSLAVGIRNAVLEVAEGGKVEPSTCPAAPFRDVLLQRPTVSVANDTLTLTTATAAISLRVSRPAPFRTTRITRYTSASRSSRREVATEFVSGGLRRASVPVGCNVMDLAIAFSKNRFVIDPWRTITAVGCPPSRTTAAELFVSNRTGTGTWARRGNTLTLRFVDGAVATITLRRIAPLL